MTNVQSFHEDEPSMIEEFKQMVYPMQMPVGIASFERDISVECEDVELQRIPIRESMQIEDILNPLVQSQVNNKNLNEIEESQYR